jgi:hypothetical protein
MIDVVATGMLAIDSTKSRKNQQFAACAKARAAIPASGWLTTSSEPMAGGRRFRL